MTFRNSFAYFRLFVDMFLEQIIEENFPVFGALLAPQFSSGDDDIEIFDERMGHCRRP